MKKLISMLSGPFIFLIFLVSPAHALRVIVATIFMGEVQVIGIQAKRSADISWEGGVVTHANRGGAFLFSTTDLPTDCVGKLSDGVSTISVVIRDCTTRPLEGGVIQTGQIACYDGLLGDAIPCADTGQDGEFRKGVARSYTDNGQTIADNATGLEWEKLCNDAVNPACPTIHDVNTFYTWDQAFQKIADLNAANFAGHNDWRLPNINELQTLLDYGRADPAIDPIFNNGTDSFTFPEVQSFPCAYWTSTTYAGASEFVWMVRAGDGFVSGRMRVETFNVRAVRGGS
jgi:hypothetical protein